MNLPSSRHSIQPPAERVPAVEQPLGEVPVPEEASPPEKPLSWTWQLVVFLWATSVLFLALYELLWAIFRVVLR